MTNTDLEKLYNFLPENIFGFDEFIAGFEETSYKRYLTYYLNSLNKFDDITDNGAINFAIEEVIKFIINEQIGIKIQNLKILNKIYNLEGDDILDELRIIFSNIGWVLVKVEKSRLRRVKYFSHSTNVNNIDSIMSKGLLTYKNDGNWFEDTPLPESFECLFLTMCDDEDEIEENDFYEGEEENVIFYADKNDLSNEFLDNLYYDPNMYFVNNVTPHIISLFPIQKEILNIHKQDE